MYRYNLKSTCDSSEKYGDCEICGKHVSEVYHQMEEKFYNFVHDNIKYEGWTKHECKDYFGHKECLESKRR